MAAQVEICNLALQKLGLDPIVSINDAVKAARAMKTAYDMQRQNELRAHHWKFAEVDVNLAALTATPVFTWQLQYQLPTDCLRLVTIAGVRQTLGTMNYRTGEEGERLYTIKGRKLLTNLPAPLGITYIADVTDTTLFDANFNDMFACRLGIQTCYHLTQNDNLKNSLAKEYKRALNQAVLSGSVELPPEGIADDSFVLSRL